MATSLGLLDPGSRPVSRGLAGMTNCDLAYQGREIKKDISPLRPVGHGVFTNFFNLGLVKLQGNLHNFVVNLVCHQT